MDDVSVHIETRSGDPFAYRGAKLIAAVFTAEACERCGVSVVIPDEGVYTEDGSALCHGCEDFR